MFWVMDALSIFCVILLGIFTSIDDIRFSKIQNKWIAFALISGFLLLLIRAYLVILSGLEMNIFYFLEFLINLFITFVAGIVIWELGFWAAADAKLFLAYAALIPLNFYQWGYINLFPSFVILVNTFVPYLIVILISGIFKTGFRDKTDVLVRLLRPRRLLQSAVFIVAFSWLVGFIFRTLRINAGFIVMMALIFLMSFLFTRFLKIDVLIAGAAIVLVGILIDPNSFLSFAFIKRSLIIFVIFFFINFFFDNVRLKLFYSTPVDIKKLQPGMILDDEIYKKGGVYSLKSREPDDVPSYDSRIQKKDKKAIGKARSFCIISRKPDGLTAKDIDIIKELYRLGKIKSHDIKIAQTLPFAPFMFFGVLSTIIVSGNLFVAIRFFIGTV